MKSLNNETIEAGVYPDAGSERILFLLSATPAVIYTCKAYDDFGATFITENVEKQFGYKAHEFIDDPKFWVSHIHPDDVKKVSDGLALLFEHNHHTHDYRFLHKDGKYRWMRDELKLVRDDEGNPKEIIGYWIDITDRKEIADSLKLQSEIITTMSEGVFLIKLSDGIIVFTNPRSEEIFGYESGELIGKHASIVNAPTDKSPEETAKEIMDIINTNGYWQGEVNNIKKDGTSFWCYVNVSLFEHPEYGTVLISVHSDITARKKGEEERIKTLAKSEAAKTTQEMFENMIDGVVLTDAEGKIILSNKAIADMTGYGKAVIGKMPTEFVVERDLERVVENIGTVFTTGYTNNFECTLLNKNNKEIPALVSANLLRNPDGSPKGITAIVKDITELKKAEKVIRETSNRLIEAQSLARLGNWEWNPVIDEITGSEEFYRLFDISDKSNLTKFEQFIGRLHPDDIEHVQQDVADSLKQKRQYDTEYRVKSNNGGWRNIHARGQVFTDTEDKPVRMVGTCLDITERKLAEQILQNLNMAIRNSKEVVFLTDKEGIITYINPEFTKIYGYTAKEVIGKTTPRILKSGFFSREQYEEFWKSLRSKKNIPTVQYKNKCKDGSIIDIEGSADPILDDKGEIFGFLSIQRGITERKLAEKELIEAKEKAEQMSRLKSNFLANMSHELRTPLVGIIGFSEELVKELKVPEFKEMAKVIYKSGNRLSETLNLILDLSKLESELTNFKYERIDLLKETEDTLTLFKEAARKKGLYLKLSFSNSSIFINTDQSALRSILNNLINNAIKYTMEGGVTADISLKDKFVEIKIIDTGVGISKEYHKMIFEEFRQASEGYSRNFEGTGLGLNITKMIVEKFGGKISVESEAGKGSTFIVKLPLTKVEEKINEKPAIEKTVTKGITEKKQVKPLALLVDDDPIVYSVLKRMLDEQVDLDSIVDAECAVKMLKKKKYDTIFMDINLKCGMNGIQATKEIRKMKGYESSPIIAITAYAMAGDKEKFLAAGCTHYLSKPFNKQDVLNLLEEIPG